MPHVIHPQLVLESVLCRFSLRQGHHPCVVQEHVQRFSRIQHRGAEVLDRLERGKVQQSRVVVGEGDGDAWGGDLSDCGQRAARFRGVPASQDDVEAAPRGEGPGCDEADARVGARDEDGPVVLVRGLGLDDDRRSAPEKERNNKKDFLLLISSRFFSTLV